MLLLNFGYELAACGTDNDKTVFSLRDEIPFLQVLAPRQWTGDGMPFITFTVYHIYLFVCLLGHWCTILMDVRSRD